jgi:prepilin-type N-terminal cleavage/methylation domain-containing protein
MIRRPSTRARRGFTLLELIVVAAILALILSFTIPAVVRARKAGAKAKLAQDLQAIASGLEEFKNNYGQYPQTDLAALPYPVDGATALMQAMTGKRWDPTASPPQLVSINDPKSGRARGPLIQVDKFNVKTKVPGSSNSNPAVWLRDSNDLPILYFPARVPSPNIAVANGYVADLPSALFSHLDCPKDPQTSQYYLKLADMKQLLGDIDQNGAIVAPEVAGSKGPYLLWSAGADALLGLDPSGKSDDVIHGVDLPGQYRK